MFYHLDNNASDLMRADFFKIRSSMDLETDALIFRCKYEEINNGIKEQLYLKILMLEGEYRAENNTWKTGKLNLEIISVL